MQSRISHPASESLSLTCARYYTAQIIDAIEYMHDKDVIHRYVTFLPCLDQQWYIHNHIHSKTPSISELKPQNLLLDDEFRIKVTDFGTGKILEDGRKSSFPRQIPCFAHSHPATAEYRANSFVGTAQYVSPELLERKGDVQEVYHRRFPIDLTNLRLSCMTVLICWSLGCIVFQMIAGRFAF